MATEDKRNQSGVAARRKAKIKEAQLRGAETRRVKTEDRLLNSFLELGRSTDADRKITATEICKHADISPATFYGRFPDGTADLIQLAAVRLRDNASELIAADIDRRGGAVEQGERVAVAVARLVEQLTTYPNLFNVERIIPKQAIYDLAAVIEDAIIGTRQPSEEIKHRAEIIAKYHTTTVVGILRTTLGDHVDRPDYRLRVARRTVSQILPVLATDESAFDEEIDIVGELFAGGTD